MRHPPSRGARMTVHVSYIRCQSYNVEIDSFHCKRPANRPAGRTLFVREFLRTHVFQGSFKVALPPDSSFFHEYVMSIFHIYEGMKVATLVATLPF